MQSVFQGPPPIPNQLDPIIKYKIETRRYFNTIKAIVWIFIQIIATMLVLGLIWITVRWVKYVITALALFMTLILIIVLSYILY